MLFRSPIIAHSVSTGTKTYFLRAIANGTESKDAEYCQKLFMEELSRAESIFNAEVIGGITDNCNTMECTRRMLQDDLPELYFYGCNSHLLNLVGQNLTDDWIKTQIVQVQNYFWNNDYPSGRLKELKGKRPVVPSDTRWNSQLDCFESYLLNQTKYLEISTESRANMPLSTKEIIQRNEIYSKLTEAVGILRPVAHYLDKVLSNMKALA